MLYTSSAQFTFDIRVEVVTDSIYGHIVLVGQQNRISTDNELECDVPRGTLELDKRYFLYNPIQISLSCQGPSALLAGYGTGNILSTLYVADYRQIVPLRHVEWRPLTRHYGTANSEDTEPASEYGYVRWISYRDPNNAA